MYSHESSRLNKWLRILAVGLLLPLATVACTQLTEEQILERIGALSIELSVETDSNLNLFEGLPSSLALCLYQLSDRKAFDAMRDGEGGLDILMQCDVWDDSVFGRQREFFNPGEKRTITLERRKGVKYLVVAAGFHGAGFENAARIVELAPVSLMSKYEPVSRYQLTLRGHGLDMAKIERWQGKR